MDIEIFERDEPEEGVDIEIISYERSFSEGMYETPEMEKAWRSLPKRILDRLRGK